jgi:biopolymer transport protein ExbD
MKVKQGSMPSAEMDMTPMIDVTFQLITFFMLVINFEQTQADERVKLPRDKLAKPPEVKLEHELVINVGYLRDETGKKIDPTPYVLWAGENIRVLDMGQKFQQEKRIYKSQNQDIKTVTMVIRADAEVPTGLIQELIRLAQESSFEKFALKATQAIAK